MNLNEYQSKRVLETLDIPVSRGVLCVHPEAAEDAVLAAGEGPWVVKAQIASGGRARGRFKNDPAGRGGVSFVSLPEEAVAEVQRMLGATLVTAQTGTRGALVDAVCIEPRRAFERALYVALTVDRQRGQLMFLASGEGGSNIEDTLRETPERCQRVAIDVDEDLHRAGSLITGLSTALEIEGPLRAQFAELLTAMYRGFLERDMLLCEINPLVMTADRRLLALDAAIVYDDNALFRQGHIEQMQAYEHLPEPEYNALLYGLNYIKLEGNIGTLSSGAGLAMATMDALIEAGGQPGNFLDLAPSATVADINNAMDLLCADEDLQLVLINVFGGGIMRCDALVDVLLERHQKKAGELPLVVRLAGTNSELARQRLLSSPIGAVLANDFADAANQAVRLAHSLARAAEDRSVKSPWWLRMRDHLASPQQ